MKNQLMLIALACLALLPLKAGAQDPNLVYTKEIGGGLGLNFMLSDLNDKWYGGAKFSGEALLRFVISPRMAVKTTLGYNAIGGNTDRVKDFYPVQPKHVSSDRLKYSMSGGIIDLNAMYELHFLPYGWWRNYLEHKRITPYVQLGLGLLYSTAGKAFTLGVPVGLGLKYKIAPRLNLGLDWAMHFCLSDKLDGLSGPAGIESSGFHGKDFYSRTMLTLTYDIAPKCPTCNKAD